MRLFTKLFLVMTVSIVAVCLLTSLITIRMSERLFAETFSITNGKVLKQINTSLDSFNDSIVNAVTYAAQSGTVKTYLTGGELDSVSMSKVFYRMSEQMDRLATNLGAFDVAVTITGINGRSYSTDRSYWPVTGEELAAGPLTARTAANPGRILYQYDTRQGEGGPKHLSSRAKRWWTGPADFITAHCTSRSASGNLSSFSRISPASATMCWYSIGAA
ncbi:hypothetical protein HMSSN036_76130 [Paenibacillus macerans]|nr:hypothetical protein HMSSN036_76130 [Paenibacillus macerans]